MLKYTVFSNTNGTISNKIYEVNPDVAEQVDAIKKLAKLKNTLVGPLSNEAAAIIMVAKGRELNWATEVVKTAHELAVAGKAIAAIKFDLFVAHKVQVNDDAVRKTLRQEANTHQDIGDELRQKAKEVIGAKASGKGGGRRKLDDAQRKALALDIHNGMSGTEAAEKYQVTNSTANKIYREVYKVYRKAALAGQAVPSKA